MKKYLVLAAMAAIFASGCATPNYLVTQKFHGADRTVKEVYQYVIQGGAILSKIAGKDDNAEYYNYIVRVCNIDDQGNSSQCMDTVVLENVMQDSLYRNFSQGQ